MTKTSQMDLPSPVGEGRVRANAEMVKWPVVDLPSPQPLSQWRGALGYSKNWSNTHEHFYHSTRSHDLKRFARHLDQAPAHRTGI